MVNLPKRYTPNGDSVSGGMGRVDIYKDNHLERDVAIKSINDISQKHRIIDELNALMQLRSKHVVQVFDRIIENDGVIRIIEEYINGDDLFTSTMPQQSEENYLKTLWQIASGIADIHSVGVIHRDIKPNNIKLDQEGIIKIFDFGLSRNEGDTAKTQGFKGTFGYAAPELIQSGWVVFSQAVDTYAFGVMAIRLTGSELPDELLYLPPQPLPSKFFSSLSLLPSNLVSIIEKCLAFNPSHRPSMVQVRDEIARYLLKDKHQALAVNNNNKQSYIFNSTKRSISLNITNIGNLTINYDGFKFFILTVSGEVFINNQPAITGQEIPASSVITIGNSSRRNDRRYITFDISNPEVVL